MLIASIVQHNRDRQAIAEGAANLAQQGTNGCRINRSVIGHGDELMGAGIEGRQDVEALATATRLNKDPDKAPQIAEKGLQDKVRGVHEEEVALTCLRFLAQRR